MAALVQVPYATDTDEGAEIGDTFLFSLNVDGDEIWVELNVVRYQSRFGYFIWLVLLAVCVYGVSFFMM